MDGGASSQSVADYAITPVKPNPYTDMRPEQQAFAQQLEQKLRPIASLAIAAGGGGCDSHRHPLPRVEERLECVADDLRAISEWAETYAMPAKESRRGRR